MVDRTLRRILSLEGVGDDVYRSTHPSPDHRPFFGGEVAAHAVRAAGLTIDGDRPVHSASFHYLRAGDGTRHTHYRVQRLRDGASFSSRAVQAWQADELLLTASVSFQSAEEGAFSHETPPEGLKTFAPPTPGDEYVGDEAFANWHATVQRLRALDVTFREPPVRVAGARGETVPARHQIWYRSPEPLGPEPLIHAAALTYASDLFLLAVALGPHRVTYATPGIKFATLNHTIWFHRSAHADEWFLYDEESPWAGGSRALCRGRMYDSRGNLLATTMQEGLLRLRPQERS